MGKKLTIRKLLTTKTMDYFWKLSNVNDVFRPSVFFNEIISGYLSKIEGSHVDGEVYACNLSLEYNMYLENGDNKIIKFINGPVAAKGNDFKRKRAEDYSKLADMIEAVHAHYFLPDIKWDNSPELYNFLAELRTSSGKELWISQHYSLWLPDQRFTFLIDLEARCANKDFAIEFKQQMDEEDELPLQYIKALGGLEQLVANDEYLSKHAKKGEGYEISYWHLFHFSRNIAGHYSENPENHTKSDIDWKLFKYLPFIMDRISQSLYRLGLYYTLASKD